MGNWKTERERLLPQVLVYTGLWLGSFGFFNSQSATAKKSSNPKTSLQQAYQLFNDRKFSALEKLASAHKTDPQWGDYYRWLTIESLQQSKRKNKKNRIHQAWMEIERDFPASALLNLKPYSLMQVDLNESASLRSFVRADLSKLWNRMPASTLESVAKYCDTHPEKTDECEEWGERIAEVYSDNSVEYETFLGPTESTEKKSGGDKNKKSKNRKKKKNKKKKPTEKKIKKTKNYPTVDEAHFLDAIQLYKSNSLSDAQEKLENFFTTYPDSKHELRARYWYAKTLKERGKKEESQKAFEYVIEESPLSWYGTLSAIETGISIRDRFKGDEMEEYDEAEAPLKPLDQQHWSKANALMKDTPSWALHELRAIDLMEKDPETGGWRIKADFSNEFLYALAKKFHELNDHHHVFALILELLKRKADGIYTAETLDLFFPVSQYDDLIKEAAKAKNIDFLLMKSLIKQESSFNADAISPSNAFSLMQVVPRTASGVEKNVSRVELRNPEINLRIGSKYLEYLISRFSGKIALVLTGYNAGPNHKWILPLSQEASSMELYVEQIPLRETRLYVGAIFRNYVWFKLLYENTVIADLSSFWGEIKAIEKQAEELPPDVIPPEELEFDLTPKPVKVPDETSDE